MDNFFRSLKTKLFFWYLGSLLLLTLIFFLFVHYLAIPYGTDLFFLIFMILTIIGFIIIYKIVSSITYLTRKISMISEKNLNERITGIENQDEIGLLAENFNKLLDRLDQAFRRERQFIADVAHEMKTPLATLMSELEITMQKSRNEEEYQEALKDALAETNRLSSTLKNVLDLAWTESPTTHHNKQKINLSELVNELADIAKKMAMRKKIQVKVNIEKNIFVMGFKDKLARAILNIIDNAIKYSQLNGQIDIMLEQSPTLAVITIRDKGRGITESEVPQIFDRFYRGKKTDKVFGAGLGLAIAKSIIAIHQGEIKVKSKINHGTIFVIALPKVG